MNRKFWLFLIVVFVAFHVSASETTKGLVVFNKKSRLKTIEVGSGNLPVILLHGYTSKPEDWLSFTNTIHLPAGGFFVFPEGPEATAPPEGQLGGRAWWPLDLASYIPPGSALPDLSKTRPLQLSKCVKRVRTLLSEIKLRSNSGSNPLILGGFSQGAIIASDIAFRTNEPLEALIILSGTAVDESTWIQGMSKRRDLPVFISHGRKDATFSFEIANRLQQEMRNAGMNVTWVPFEGGHEMPVAVVNALNIFLANIKNK
jgi:phospholipase/carboxylesterase